MKNRLLCIIVLLVLYSTSLTAQQKATGKKTAADSPSYKVQFVTVQKDVKLEVLDWGGTGRPLIFLAGLGDTAHVFDNFAPKFTPKYHVYAITRRGFGRSSAPAPTEENYSADRLGNDVLAVMDALKLREPVLVGHSFAGEVLSDIGSRYPQKVAGLIYLDAGYSYAYYDSSLGDSTLDAIDLRNNLNLILSGKVHDQKLFVQDLQTSLSRFEKDVQRGQRKMALFPAPPKRVGNPTPILVAISNGERKFTKIYVPVLAIFADPHNFGQLYKNDPPAREAVIANDRESTTAQAKAFRTGMPSAHVILIPNASHYVFRSNEAEVFRDMNAFLSKLP